MLDILSVWSAPVAGFLGCLTILGLLSAVCVYSSIRNRWRWAKCWKRRGKARQCKSLEYAVSFSYQNKNQISSTMTRNGNTLPGKTAVVCISEVPPQHQRGPPADEEPLFSKEELEASFASGAPLDEGSTEERTSPLMHNDDTAFVASASAPVTAGETLDESGDEGPSVMSFEDFPDHVRVMKDDSNSFEDEWARLSDRIEAAKTAGKLEANFKKNRYKNILPYDHSRVVLEKVEGIPHSDYVNANYIQSSSSNKVYIASQGPNVTSLADFWRLIWQKGVDTIVMVTNLTEKGKIKCEKYWPDLGEEMTFDTITVRCEEENDGVTDTKRILLAVKDDACRSIEQFHFTQWPDKGVPRNVSILLRFIQAIKRSHDDKQSPLLVHCSAGVGRTGVVIALDNEMDRIRESGTVDIFNFVKSMRVCRPQMVQTPEQYEFIHDAILEFLLCKDTLIPRDNINERVKELLNACDEDEKTNIEKEFEILDLICHEPPSDTLNVGNLAENTSKNRYQNILPRNKHRPLLMTTSTGSAAQYINATFCLGYKERERILTTQMPLPGTVTDFLSLIYDYRISTIVTLNDITKEEAASVYWEHENPNIAEPFAISVLDIVETELWIDRTLELKYKKNTRIIQQFQFLAWDNVGTPEFFNNFLNFLNNVTSQEGGDSPLLVHCMNGIGRTAVFCVIKMCLDQLEKEDAVDVFQMVKGLRNDNHQMVQSLDDYKLCYSILSHLMTQEVTDDDSEIGHGSNFASDVLMDINENDVVQESRSDIDYMAGVAHDGHGLETAHVVADPNELNNYDEPDPDALVYENMSNPNDLNNDTVPDALTLETNAIKEIDIEEENGEKHDSEKDDVDEHDYYLYENQQANMDDVLDVDDDDIGNYIGNDIDNDVITSSGLDGDGFENSCDVNTQF